MYYRHTSKMAIIEKESLENGIKSASEAVTNIRTVASLSVWCILFRVRFSLSFFTAYTCSESVVSLKSGTVDCYDYFELK